MEHKKKLEIDAPRAWGMDISTGKLLPAAYALATQWSASQYAIPVRILRESDFRKLLRAARGKR